MTEEKLNGLSAKMAKLKEAIDELKEIRNLPKNTFFTDKKIQHAVFYDFVMAIEAIVDVGNHILAQHFQKPQSTYKDVVQGLGEVGIIPKTLADRSEKMPDFRNVLIHIYENIDIDKVYKNLQKGPEEFEKFAKCFVKFLEKF